MWVNDDRIFIFWWSIPLNIVKQITVEKSWTTAGSGEETNAIQQELKSLWLMSSGINYVFVLKESEADPSFSLWLIHSLHLSYIVCEYIN